MMNKIIFLKDYLVDFYFNFFAKLYYTKMPVSIARKFHNYHKKCIEDYKSDFLIKNDIQDASRGFLNNGYTQYNSKKTKEIADKIYKKIKKIEELDSQIWEKSSNNTQRFTDDPYLKFPEIESLLKGDLGGLVSAILGCNFDLFALTLMKSEQAEGSRYGSQLWHVDGNPGSCVNIIFYLHKIDKKFDPTSVLSFNKTLEITKNRRVLYRQFINNISHKTVLDKDSKAEVRRKYSNFYNNIIKTNNLSWQPTGDSGLIIAFRNNTLHRGGYPEAGNQRYAIAFNFYPSKESPNYKSYREKGIKKESSYPQIPVN